MSEAAKRRRSCAMGYLTALCGPVIAMPEREPVAYLYNGVRLSGLPEWDRGVYPYAVIISKSDVYYFIFNSTCYEVYDDGTHHIPLSGDFAYEFSDGVWKSNYLLGTSVTIVWANHDVVYKSGEVNEGQVYLAASEPIPVYE